MQEIVKFQGQIPAEYRMLRVRKCCTIYAESNEFTKCGRLHL